MCKKKKEKDDAISGVMLICTNCGHHQAFYPDGVGIDLLKKETCSVCGENIFLLKPYSVWNIKKADEK
jgi:hypothetical protein